MIHKVRLIVVPIKNIHRDPDDTCTRHGNLSHQGKSAADTEIYSVPAMLHYMRGTKKAPTFFKFGA